MDRVREYSETGTFTAQLDLSHTIPDWESVLSLGAAGLRDRALRALKSARNEEQENFYTAAANAFESACGLIRRSGGKTGSSSDGGISAGNCGTPAGNAV